jgi:hypothetical protein
MNLRNTSPYHTATLRQIITTTFRTLRAEHGEVDREWPIKIIVEEGRKNVRWQWVKDQKVSTILLSLPKLTGTEFIPLLRQQYGGSSNTEHGGLRSQDIALAAQQAVHQHFIRWLKPNSLSTLVALSVRAALMRAKIPEYVPLRVRKEPKPQEPRNVVQDRYKRVLELEAKWQRKIKLAQTKLKKLRLKRRHYEKKLSKEQT